MKRIIHGLLAALFMAGAALAQQFPANMPANTVYGRLGVPAQGGPGQAIPFGILLPQIYPGALNVVHRSITGTDEATGSDCGSILALGGSTFYVETLGAASGFSAFCAMQIVNEDIGRAKYISVSAGTSFYLWPGQSVIMFNDNNNWQASGRSGDKSRWKAPSGQINFFADFTNGSDTFGATDGLAAGASAFKSVEHALLIAADQLDFNSLNQTQVVVNMAANTADTTGLHTPLHALVGAQGGAAFQIVGASLAITGAANNGGGLVRLTISSTATYTTNQIVSVYGVTGTTEANGTWKVTVVDGTHLDLQGSAFANAYVSGGTITNGSSFNVTGSDALSFYFGTVAQLKNVLLQSNVNDLSMFFGSKIYILDGVVFGGAVAGAHLNISDNSYVEFDGSRYGIATAAPWHALMGNGGSVRSPSGTQVDFLPGLNPAFSQSFVLAQNGGRLLWGNYTINLNGNTVTGKRWQADNLGLIQSATGVPNTFFPGNAAGTTSGGGQGV